MENILQSENPHEMNDWFFESIIEYLKNHNGLETFVKVLDKQLGRTMPGYHVVFNFVNETEEKEIFDAFDISSNDVLNFCTERNFLNKPGESYTFFGQVEYYINWLLESMKIPVKEGTVRVLNVFDQRQYVPF